METKEYRLTEVCDFQGGTQPPKEEWITEPRDGYVRMLQIRDFTQDKAEHVGYVKDTKKLNKCEEDDILIGRYGASVGKILTGLAGAYNVAIIKTIPNESLLSKRYLYYVLTGMDFQNFILNIGARAAQAGFNKNDLSLFKLNIPTSLEDQERIADVLEQTYGLILKRRNSIDLLDKLLQMKFLEMFGDNERNALGFPKDSLQNLVAKDCPLTYGIVQPGDEKSKGIPVVRPVDLTKKRIGLNGLKKIDSAISKKFKRTILKGNELLMCVRGTTGIISIAEKELKGSNVTRGITPIWFNSNSYNNQFAFYLLKSDAVQREIQKYTYGIALKQINLSDLRELSLINPPIDDQNKFSLMADKFDNIITLLEKSQNKYQELYNSLSHNALKGELKVIEKVFIKATTKVQPKISGEVIAINKINKELEEFHQKQPHSGAPDEIDNKIRQLEAELKIRGEIPFWGEYVKYRIVKGKFKEPFTFDQLWEEITKFPFETIPEYDEVSTLLFRWLAEENAFIRQQFNPSTKQIELIVNETAKA